MHRLFQRSLAYTMIPHGPARFCGACVRALLFAQHRLILDHPYFAWHIHKLVLPDKPAGRCGRNADCWRCGSVHHGGQPAVRAAQRFWILLPPGVCVRLCVYACVCARLCVCVCAYVFMSHSCKNQALVCVCVCVRL